MKYVIMALLSGCLAIWLVGCGAMESATLANQIPAEEAGQEQSFSTRYGGGYEIENGDENFAEIDDVTQGNGNSDGGGNGGNTEDRPWLPLTLGGFVGTYQMCGSPWQYLPSEGYETITVVAIGGKNPEKSYEYLVRWFFPDESYREGTLAEVGTVRISLDTIGDLVAYISDDDGETWEEFNLISIVPYFPYEKGGKG